MRRAITIFSFAAATVVCTFVVWARITQFSTTDPLDVFLLFVVFGASNLGTFWMLYIVIRYEKRPFPLVLLAFIPYLFLWYYVQRYRHGKPRTKIDPPLYIGSELCMSSGSRKMRRDTTILALAAVAVVYTLVAWGDMTQFRRADAVDVFLFFLVFGVTNVGTLWMLYIVIRYEKRPFPLVLLAFIPYLFLWYYIQRYRSGKHSTRTDPPLED